MRVKNVVGGFLQLLHPFALLGGVMFLLLCIVHGLQFLTIRTTGKLRERARIAAIKNCTIFITYTSCFLLVWGYGKPTFSLLMEQNGLWYQSELL